MVHAALDHLEPEPPGRWPNHDGDGKVLGRHRALGVEAKRDAADRQHDIEQKAQTELCHGANAPAVEPMRVKQHQRDKRT